jgi:hypothetical protein
MTPCRYATSRDVLKYRSSFMVLKTKQSRLRRDHEDKSTTIVRNVEKYSPNVQGAISEYLYF